MHSSHNVMYCYCLKISTKKSFRLTEFVVECETLKHALVHQSLFFLAVRDQFVSLGLKLALPLRKEKNAHTYELVTVCDVEFSCRVSIILNELASSPPGKNRLHRSRSQ